MNVFTMIVLIVLLGCFTAVAEQWLKTKRKKYEAKTEDPKTLELLKKQEERIANLESIILQMEKEKKYRDLE